MLTPIELRKSVATHQVDAFMWETWMSKPYHDNHDMKRVGEVVTPWPCFMIASSLTIIKEKEEALRSVLKTIHEVATEFMKAPESWKQVCDHFPDLEPQDVEK